MTLIQGSSVRRAPAPDRPLYLALNRFTGDVVDYRRFAGEFDVDMVFITLESGLSAIDTGWALDVVVVDDLSLATVLPVAQRLIARHRPLTGAVGLSEKDVVAAARLREALGLPGPGVDLAHRFKDKVAMKSRLEAVGLRVPRFRPLAAFASSRPAEVAAALDQALAFPIILKPVDEGASRGIIEVRTPAELEDALAGIDVRSYEAEEFVDGPILHVDGIMRDGALWFISSSEYIGTCLDFARSGAPFASVILDPGPRRSAAEEYTLACLTALGLTQGPFHLELIEPSPGVFVFLEAGMRPGGAEVPHLHAEHVHIDLYGEAFRSLLDLPPLADRSTYGDPTGLGYLLFAVPYPLPSRVTARTSLIGTVEHLYAEVLPEVGHVFTKDGGYVDVGGRFRFRSPNEEQTRAAVDAALKAYRLESAPVTP
ncbi:acetyl-CoA carboxylase biotin carboxylase subunit family protein [Actinoplanes sp. NPDC051494]|uniref:acetyl-CoA carboxylase biotin carboxylase subunit family protein n=1 Tax=Actinoplanes sp. NPDC051494 TaxID=3363907 RepID=UPI00379FC8D4